MSHTNINESKIADEKKKLFSKFELVSVTSECINFKS
jgi:hypothetical protein